MDHCIISFVFSFPFPSLFFLSPSPSFFSACSIPFFFAYRSFFREVDFPTHHLPTSQSTLLSSLTPFYVFPLFLFLFLIGYSFREVHLPTHHSGQWWDPLLGHPVQTHLWYHALCIHTHVSTSLISLWKFYFYVDYYSYIDYFFLLIWVFVYSF